MKLIQMILAVFLIAALCGKVTSADSDDTDYGNGYCTNTDCQTGYDYYDNRGYCRYGDMAEIYKYSCESYAGCCLPHGQVKHYCTNENGCPRHYYFYNNKGYYYYNNKDYFNCVSYKGCCIRREY